MERILIIDGNTKRCESLLECLQTEGFNVVTVHDGSEGLQQVLSGDYALTVVDILISFAGGTHVLQGIRSLSNIPVIMIAGSDRDEDRIEALEMGADDCLPQPFNPREFKARVHALLRRTKANSDEAMPASKAFSRIVVGDIEIDTGMRVAYREGMQIGLTSIEFNLLSILLRDAGQVITREELARRALGRSLGMNDRSIDMHISSLRKKLGKHFSGIERISTVRNWGYLYARLHQPLETKMKDE